MEINNFRYFTEIGINQIVEKYKKLEKNSFVFNEKGDKCKLDFIDKQKTNFENSYYAVFHFENIVSLNIHDFMKYNPEIEYDFEEFETKVEKI